MAFSGSMLPVAILAGGLATRLRPLTENVPKALLSINAEPFIAHQLRLLVSRGIDRVVLCVGYLGELIQDFAGDGSGFGLTVEYSFDGPTLCGTAGAVKKALPLLGREFFVLYGDSYLPCDYRAVANAFHDSRKQALMTVFHNQGKWDASNVEFSNGQIQCYDKKHTTTRMRHIDYGLGVFRATAFAPIADQPGDLADVYGRLLARGQLAACEVPERFYEIGSLTGLQELSDHLKAIRKPGDELYKPVPS
jgi:NDP-sugar pyrophosphorylase family protein